MSKLVLTLRGGLGSRVYSLLCARIFTRHLGHEMEFFWPVETECACSFDLLFEDRAQSRGPVDPAAPGLHLEDSMGQSIERIAQTLAEGRDVYLSTFYAELRPEGMTAACFQQELYTEAALLRPVAAVRARIRSLPPGTVGLQIRRQDHWRNTRYSPLTLFFRVIDRTLRQDPAATFFLCTDSGRVRRWMRWRYGARVRQTEELGERDTASGVQDALAEAFTLAQAERVYRCNYGCFAAFVELLAGRQTIQVRLRKAPRDYYSRPSDRRHDELLSWDQKKLAWRPRRIPRSLRAKLEIFGYRLLNWFITSDLYQLWPFHAWGLKELGGPRKVAPGVAQPSSQIVPFRGAAGGQK